MWLLISPHHTECYTSHTSHWNFQRFVCGATESINNWWIYSCITSREHMKKLFLDIFATMFSIGRNELDKLIPLIHSCSDGFKKHQPSCTEANATTWLTRISNKRNTKIIIKLKRNIFFRTVFPSFIFCTFYPLVLLFAFGLWKWKSYVRESVYLLWERHQEHFCGLYVLWQLYHSTENEKNRAKTINRNKF